MDATQSFPDPLKSSIDRCAAALGDRVRLKQELVTLRDVADARAHFVRALFQLELARNGDPEARSNIPAAADALLVFWRDGSGDELASLHPALGPLWVGAASLLISFEIKRFEKALHDCWMDRSDPVRLKVAMEGLQPDENDRVEFARCLYHLELARLGIDGSRLEFAQRVGLLMQAYRSEALATELIGGDNGLKHLWTEVKPYLEEFFDAQEEPAEKAAPPKPPEPEQEEPAAERQEPTRRVHIDEISPRNELKTDPALRALNPSTTAKMPAYEPTGSSNAPTGQMPVLRGAVGPIAVTDELPALDAEREAPAPPPPPPQIPRAVPSFRALVHDNPNFVGPGSTAPQHPRPEPAPPPPPAEAQGEMPLLDGEVEATVEAAPPPPAPAPFSSSTPTLFDMELLASSLEPKPPAPLLEEHSAPTPPGGEAVSLGDFSAPTPPGGEALRRPPPLEVPLGDFSAPTPPGGVAMSLRPPAAPPLGDFSAPTPPGGQAMALRGPSLGETFEPTPPGGEVEIVEAEEAPALPPPPPPPPPAITPANGLEAAVAIEAAVSIEEDLDADVDLDDEPDEATLTFWDYTFGSLQLPPVEGQKPRMFATESKTDRKRLATYVEGLTPHSAVPEAKVFGCLVQLILAAETKEKSLFGQANPKRQEALATAFGLLAGGTPQAAGKASVWFELDGRESEDALHRGLELLVPFLAFCARNELDPTKPEAAARYLEK